MKIEPQQIVDRARVALDALLKAANRSGESDHSYERSVILLGLQIAEQCAPYAPDSLVIGGPTA